MEGIKEFLTVSFGSGSSDGSDSGYGYGFAPGSGSSHGSGYGFDPGYGFAPGYGSSHGSGYGFAPGYGSDSGYGSGYGFGPGSGYGSGDGSGYGSGDGYDSTNIKTINGMNVYIIDSIPTIIQHIRGNVAKGFILNSDLTLDSCYVVKRDNLFAHGETLREAEKALEDKLIEDMDVEERIEAFLEEFKAPQKYPAQKFFDWHHKLTGSCLMGRENFVKNHGIDMENGMYTVSEFIELTKNDFGSSVIKELETKVREKQGG